MNQSSGVSWADSAQATAAWLTIALALPGALVAWGSYRQGSIQRLFDVYEAGAFYLRFRELVRTLGGQLILMDARLDSLTAAPWRVGDDGRPVAVLGEARPFEPREDFASLLTEALLARTTPEVRPADVRAYAALERRLGYWAFIRDGRSKTVLTRRAVVELSELFGDELVLCALAYRVFCSSIVVVESDGKESYGWDRFNLGDPSSRAFLNALLRSVNLSELTQSDERRLWASLEWLRLWDEEVGR